LEAYLFRRTLGELEDNHIRIAQREIPIEVGSYKETRKRIEFFNGSGLNFCYCEKEKDVERYRGAEMHWVGIDEATHLTAYQLAFLKTRNRVGGFKAVQTEYLPRFVMASNPGGPGHNYLKSIFIDGGPPEQYFFDREMRDPKKPDDLGWKSIYIPARMADNVYLDEDYGASFGGLPPEMQKAYREGDWDAVVGMALHTLSRERHMLPAFQPPKHLTKAMSIDWGTARPFAIGWFFVSDGLEIVTRERKTYIPPGAVVMYDEWYGWNGKPNQGCRLESTAVAQGILRREDERGDVMDYRVADSQMWAQSDGPSVIERMQTTSNGRLVFRQGEKDRKANYTEFLARLKGEEFDIGKGPEEMPMFYVTENCRHFWRTVPVLVLDETDPEKGPDTSLEDHSYDLVSYFLRSRPYLTSDYDRWADANRDAMKEIGVRDSGGDPYAT